MGPLIWVQNKAALYVFCHIGQCYKQGWLYLLEGPGIALINAKYHRIQSVILYDTVWSWKPTRNHWTSRYPCKAWPSAHDDVIKWKHFMCYWLFVRGIHQWIPRTKASGAGLWCLLWSAPWINTWVNNREPGDLRRLRAHYDATVMHQALGHLQIQWFLSFGPAAFHNRVNSEV